MLQHSLDVSIGTLGPSALILEFGQLYTGQMSQACFPQLSKHPPSFIVVFCGGITITTDKSTQVRPEIDFLVPVR